MISLIFEGIKTIFGWVKEKSQAKHERNMAQIRNEARLLEEKETNNSKWAMAQLNDKDKLLRISAFILFSSSFWSHLVSPSFGKLVQESWSSMPHWQAEVLAGMSLSVFGLKKIPQIIGATVGIIKEAIQKK